MSERAGSERRGIVLAGGKGTRLYPLTKGTSKQLLEVSGKPTIYYPVTTLMEGGIKDILIISTPKDIPHIMGLLGSGENLGVNFDYKIQDEPKGLAQAFTLGERFLDGRHAAMILGDNIFHGGNMGRLVEQAALPSDQATIFASHVTDPSRFGIVEFDSEGKALSVEEKPKNPRSNWAITGLYFYPPDVVEIAANVKPSERGELEITDVNNHYLSQGRLNVQRLDRGFGWMDTGTKESLRAANDYVYNIESVQGLLIGCIEEVAFRMGFIDRHQLERLAKDAEKSPYGDYLVRVAQGRV